MEDEGRGVDGLGRKAEGRVEGNKREGRKVGRKGRKGRTYDNRLRRRDISPRAIECDTEGGDGGDERGRKHSGEPHFESL